MRTKEITVSLALTEGLPDHCNVRPGLSVTVVLEPGDSLMKAIAVLTAKVRKHVESQVDEYREEAGLSPKYDMNLHRVYYWEQREMVIILSERWFNPAGGYRGLPGQWWPLSVGVRHETAAKIAFMEATKRGGCGVLQNPSSDTLWHWWNNQTLYVAYGLCEWQDPPDYPEYNIGHTLFILHTLKLPDGLQKVDVTPRTLDGCLREFDDLGEDEWSVVGDQFELDEIVAKWLAEHPRPTTDA